MKAVDLREKIKQAQDIRSEDITIPEWDVTIRVKTMSGLERAELLEKCMDNNGQVIQKKFQLGMLVATCMNPDTEEKIFNPDDEWIFEKSCGPIEKLASAAMRVSGMSRAALEEAEKNS